jgi:hypothetical protein
MSEDNGNGGRRRVDHTQFKWIIVASLIALVLILGTIQELVK